MHSGIKEHTGRGQPVSATDRKLIALVVIALLSSAVSLLIYLSGILDPLEFKAYDLFSRHLSPERASDAVVIVEIDGRSIDMLAVDGVRWPWPRQLFAPLIDYLSEADAVFVAMPFNEPSLYGPQDDLLFAEACKRTLNVYLPVSLQRQVLRPSDEEFIRNIALRVPPMGAGPFSSALTPADPLKDAVVGAGNGTGISDKDGIYRRSPLLFRLNDYVVPHFVLSYLIRKGQVSVDRSGIAVKGARLPLDEGALLLRHYRGSWPFTALPAVEVLRASLDHAAGKSPALSKDRFKGKAVVIGVTAPGRYDVRPTPVSVQSPEVLFHATLLDALLSGRGMRPAGAAPVVILLALVSLSAALSLKGRYAPLKVGGIGSMLFVLIAALSALLFSQGIYLHITAPLAGIGASFLMAGIYGALTDGRERLFVKKIFSQHMNEELAAYIVQNPSLVKPGGRRRQVVVMLADIVGFPAIAEKIPPERAALVLHRARSAVTEVIIRNSGVVDKYVGDSIRAFWGAPLYTARDETNACRAALQAAAALGEVSRALEGEGLPRLSLRTGLHSGEALVGNLGSDRLFDYTIVGDTVEITARLESINRVFGTAAIVSEETLRKTGDIFVARELGLIEVKGRPMPLKIFELVAERTALQPGQLEVVADFHQALVFYRERRWYAAARMFQLILDKHPQDGPSRFYKRRCEYLIENPRIRENWDIVTAAEQ